MPSIQQLMPFKFNITCPIQKWLSFQIYTVSQKKLGPYLFEHNFSKYCPILIILSLLQIEINCDQAYPKIYHQYTTLQNEQECIGKCCCHAFVIKDGTVKEVTLNVSVIDKINIVSSQAVLEVLLKKSHSEFQAESSSF